MNTFSAKVAKDSVDGRSPLAALGAEVGVEDCLSKKALIERMIAVLLPEESLDSSAAVQRHAWRLLRSCLGRQAAGEQIDADFLSTEVVDTDPGSTTGSCPKSTLVPAERAETPQGTRSTTESCSKSILFRLGVQLYLITDKTT